MTDDRQSARGSWLRGVLAEYERPLVAYAARITGDVDSARDVAQEVFLRLCRKSPEELDGHLGQWLFTVCRRCALDSRRKEGRMKTLSEDRIVACERGGDPAAVAERRDGSSNVLTALSNLPANQQEVIRLRFQQGLSYKQIAGVTGLSVGNVGYLIHTAISAVRLKLGVGGDDV